MIKIHFNPAYYKRLFFHIIKRFEEDGCSYRAAALTFTSLLSLVPLMAVGVAIITAFPMFQSIEEKVQHFIFKNFVPTSGEVIQSQLQVFAKQTLHLSWIGIIFLIVTAVLMMFTIEKAFNAIWQVRGRSRGVGTFLLYWAVISLAPLLMGVSFALSDYIFSLPMLAAIANKIGLSKLLVSIIPFITASITFAFLYVAIPNIQVKIRHGLIGGIIGAVLFELAKKGFAFYMSNVTTYTLIYGTLATIPVFLLWVYLSWLIILFGAEITHALSYRHSFLSGEKLSGFHQAFRWVGYLWQAQQSRKSLSLDTLIQHDPDGYTVEPAEQLRILQAAGFIKRTANNKYVLGCDITHMTLFEFYQQLPWRLPRVSDLHCLSSPGEQSLYHTLQIFENEAKNCLNVALPAFYNKQ
ncbi:MAG: hypothetical protein K0R12_765 [Gammaproteobacteria bacterium]|jgi:membrane protein|nr:hypothetical protein [Gammaproteobacteria bacterium]